MYAICPEDGPLLFPPAAFATPDGLILLIALKCCSSRLNEPATPENATRSPSGMVSGELNTDFTAAEEIGGIFVVDEITPADEVLVLGAEMIEAREVRFVSSSSASAEGLGAA